MGFPLITYFWNDGREPQRQPWSSSVEKAIEHAKYYRKIHRADGITVSDDETGKVHFQEGDVP